MAGTESERVQTARAVLASLRTGEVALAPFAPGARWWWNGGLDLAVGEFADLIRVLHAQVADGIAVAPGLVLEQGDTVAVEATSRALLKNGKVYDNRYVFLFHFGADLIREVREYSDSAHVLATFELPG